MLCSYWKMLCQQIFGGDIQLIMRKFIEILSWNNDIFIIESVFAFAILFHKGKNILFIKTDLRENKDNLGEEKI